MPESLVGDSCFSLLGPVARQELDHRAAEAGVTSAALAAQILARELVDAGGGRSEPAPPRRDDSGHSLLPRLVHELRTPVGSLLMLSEVLEAGASGPNAGAAPNARRVRMLASDIMVVLEEISELNALQRGTMILHAHAVSIPALLAELEQGHRAAAAEVGTELEVHLDPAAPGIVQTDRECLSKVLHKLLQGAIHAGAGGRVEVRVGPGDTPRGYGLAFSFVDSGALLPPGAGRAILEPFGLADSRTRRAHGGTSLALPIAAAAARFLGGELSVSSQSGTTCFTLVLPAEPSARTDGSSRG
jgi:signal transduction histidine kinase